MDIPSLSMSMASANLSRSASVSLMKMAIEQTEQVGAMMSEMLNSAYMDMGSIIDVKI